MRFAVLLAVSAALLLPTSASASTNLRAGIQDDAWLQYGPGTLGQRLARLDQLGVDVVRVTINWRNTEPVRGTYDWTPADQLLNGLHAYGIAPLVTLWGTPAWANGGKSENWAPTSKWTFASFARRVAERYSFVRLWTVWNEPNQQRSFRPASTRVYVQQLLNPAYAAIHRVSPGSLVAGGVTAPRGSTGGVSPVDWIAGMHAAHAKLDAYAHNPYPLSPGETPSAGGCGHCETLTMATLPRLLRDVKRAFGSDTRVWLTEYGYQSNPPDRLLGVSYRKQARYMADAALRAYLAPRVDILIHYLLRDEPDVARWQSGLLTIRDIPKPSYAAFRFPVAERSRIGLRTTIWGQVRPGGRSAYRLQRLRSGHWSTVGTYLTTARGFLSCTVRAGPGTRLRIWSTVESSASPVLTVR